MAKEIELMIEFNKYKEVIKVLDCELYQVFERRNILTGMFDSYCREPIEIVVGVPASMGEMGIMLSIYYQGYPSPDEFYNDVIKELKSWIKENNFLVAGIYCPTAYDEERIRIIKRVLRENRLKKVIVEND